MPNSGPAYGTTGHVQINVSSRVVLSRIVSDRIQSHVVETLCFTEILWMLSFCSVLSEKVAFEAVVDRRKRVGTSQVVSDRIASRPVVSCRTSQSNLSSRVFHARL